eukprot:3455173-Rhodomonas_salina.1
MHSPTKSARSRMVAAANNFVEQEVAPCQSVFRPMMTLADSGSTRTLTGGDWMETQRSASLP